MTLTKKSKAELAIAYKAVMDVSILDMKAPLRYINQYVSRDVVGYGTAADEKVFSLDDYRKLIADMRKQSRGMFFKAKKTTAFQPRLIDAKTVQFMDEVSLQIGDKKNKHFVHVYITTIFKNDEGKWKMTLFHSSIPDAASSTEDTFHITESERKLKELEQVVEERTAELQTKNKELEIEASLEKVRSAAMGLYKADDLLHICEVLFAELTALGFDSLRCTLIHLFIEGKKYYYDYDYAAITGGKISTVTLEAPEKVAAFFEQIRSSAHAFDERVYEGTDLTQLKQWRKKTGQIDDPRLKTAKRLYYYFYSVGSANIGISTFEKISDEQLQLLKRFRNVFDLAYKRYTDISNAEAQAREAQIEAALEKIRSRSLAMHNSNELSELVKILYERLNELGASSDGININIIEPGTKNFQSWLSAPGLGAAICFHVPYFKHPVTDDLYASLDEGKDFITRVYSYKEKHSFFTYLYENTDFGRLPAERKKLVLESKNWEVSIAFTKNIVLSLHSYSGKIFSDAENDILKRFAKVFDQTYTRFLDLQKAEVQAREAQIEVAVERVRARALAMHKSEDLHSVVVTLKKELRELQIPDVMAATIYLNQDDGTIRILDLSNAGNDDEGQPELAMNKVFKIEDIHPKLWINRMWKRKENYFVEEANEADFKRVIDWLYTMDKAEGEIAEKIIREQKINKAWLPTVKLEKGILNIDLLQPPAPEIESILLKIGAAFDLAYKRFLDLQKAEAQAREAQIEAALERVRSRSLAMHHSHELGELVALLFEELTKLDLILYRCIIWIINPKDYSSHLWAANSEDKTIADSYFVKFIEQPYYRSIINAWKNRQPKWEYILEGEEKKNIDTILLTETELSRLPNAAKAGIRSSTKTIVSGSFNNFGFIEASGPKSHTKEQLEIVHRFGNVFDQSYTRLLDLQKAEAQAREAQTEAALERVRSRSMAMHKSEELADLSLELVKQVQALGVKTWFCAFNIYDDDPQGSLEWGSNGEGTFPKYRTPREGVFLKYYKAGQSGESLLVNVIDEQECPAHYDYLCSLPGVGDQLLKMKAGGIPFPTFQIDHVAFFKYGYIIFITYEPVPEAHDIFKRFAKVFEQTYTRFLDLQKAEAQAREAQIEAALEKVRSRTLAMQHSDELSGTAAVLFQQLIALGLEPNRLYIILIKENNPEMEAWVTDEDGSKVSMAFTGNHERNKTLLKMYQGWQQQEKSLVIDLQGEALQEYIHYLHDELKVPFKGGLEQKRRIQHVAYFNHGLIGMASPDEQPHDTIQLLERFAAVFNLTYTRFNDLKIAEAHALQAEQDLVEIKEARKNAEQALSELQATQKQLIQSEKMASLGELTAGIAHEIQNPLNFVNNFSEVSKELLDELKEAIDKGDTADAKEIMNDVIQNLEKINHHGKRADGIVKGMLQHSRKNEGKKELTDINALCDEYLRLAYHGLRAKDKSFNAKFETHFDETINNMNVVPQEIGRVVLNLINNAFYAVTERKKQNEAGYEPTVSVSTAKEGGIVSIKVKDNGTGIPQRVLDKIFQPFFTTKPTGQGTGLGLSLSYDIVTKGHGGEINVNTIDNEGTEFIIQLAV